MEVYTVDDKPSKNIRTLEKEDGKIMLPFMGDNIHVPILHLETLQAFHCHHVIQM